MGVKGTAVGAAMALIVGAGAAMAHSGQSGAPRMERVAPCGMQIRSASHCVDVQALAQALATRQVDGIPAEADSRGLARQVAAQRDEITRLHAMVASLEGQIALLQMRR